MPARTPDNFDEILKQILPKQFFTNPIISPGEALNEWLSSTRIEYRYKQVFAPMPNKLVRG